MHRTLAYYSNTSLLTRPTNMDHAHVGSVDRDIKSDREVCSAKEQKQKLRLKVWLGQRILSHNTINDSALLP